MTDFGLSALELQGSNFDKWTTLQYNTTADKHQSIFITLYILLKNLYTTSQALQIQSWNGILHIFSNSIPLAL